jgi:hypothetical protein
MVRRASQTTPANLDSMVSRRVDPESVVARQRTPDYVKARAMSLYDEFGLSEAARRLGVDRKTITRWRKQMGIASKTAKGEYGPEQQQIAQQHDRIRADIRNLMLMKTRQLLVGISDTTSGRDAKDFATAAAILMDKFRLEMGEVTGRRETVNASEQLDDHESMALMQAIQDELSRRGRATAPGPSEESPAGDEESGQA